MMTTDYRALCAELLDEVAARPLILDRELIARARAALAQPEPEGRPAPAPAEGKVAELVAELRRICFDVAPCDSDTITRAADLLERLAATEESSVTAPVPAGERQAAPVPVPVSERPWEQEGGAMAKIAAGGAAQKQTIGIRTGRWLLTKACRSSAPTTRCVFAFPPTPCRCPTWRWSMTELSPAAQAVLDAMHRSYDHEPTRRAIASGILWTLAQHLPIQELTREVPDEFEHGINQGQHLSRAWLEMVSEELRNA